MLNNILNILNVFLILGLLVFTFVLYNNTLGSFLYSRVSLLTLLLAINTILNIYMFYFEYTNTLIFISESLFIIYLYQLYNVWMITYNQTINNNKIFVFILSFLNIILLYFNLFNPNLINEYLKFIINYRLINLLLFVIVTFNYLSFYKQSKTQQIDLMPFISISMLLLELSKVFEVLNKPIYFLIVSLLNSIVLLIYFYDYKNSFYY